MGPFRLHQSSLSNIEVGFFLYFASNLHSPFSMTHAAEYPPLKGWISAALRGILGVGNPTGYSTSTSQWSQIWNRCSVSHSQPVCPCEASKERRRGSLPFSLPRRSPMWERLVLFPLILLVYSLQWMRFQPFQVLDFRLSFIETKLRNVFLSTPYKKGAKQTTTSNLRNMYLQK